MQCLKRQSKGEGLVEIMISLVIIAGCVLALARFQNSIAYNDNFTQQQSEASLLALNKLESLRDFQVINNQSPYTSYQGIATGTSSFTGVNVTYSLSWTVTSNTSPTYKVIDVTVTWTDRYGVSQSVRLSTRVGSVDPAYSGVIMT